MARFTRSDGTAQYTASVSSRKTTKLAELNNMAESLPQGAELDQAACEPARIDAGAGLRQMAFVAPELALVERREQLPVVGRDALQRRGPTKPTHVIELVERGRRQAEVDQLRDVAPPQAQATPL